jgi:signal transduction histidine kinase
MSSRSNLVIGTVGFLLTAVLAWASELSLGHAALMVAVAAGGAAAAGLAGALFLMAFRSRSFGAQATVATITPVAAVGVGAVLAAQASAMYLHPDDLPTLAVVSVAALTVALLICFALSRRVSLATQSLEAAARRIGSGDLTTPVTEPSTREFAALARELDTMSRGLDEARARERQLDASRRELVAWVSHDLRTPLSGIRAMAEALEDGIAGDPETVARYHQAMRVESERLAHLVDELFELSVINAGALNLQPESVSLGDLVSDALAGAGPAAAAQGVRLQGELSGAIPLIELSPSECTRVLRNLLENAIRHTPAGGSVWVKVGADDVEAYVSVADECGGIPENDLDRVFDLAFRGEPARSPGNGGGAGLGLAIARGLIEAHGGTIAVSNHARGCRFEIRLPLLAPPATGSRTRQDGNGQRGLVRDNAPGAGRPAAGDRRLAPHPTLTSGFSDQP